MWENLYAWEKIRKLESELDAARPRHLVVTAGVGGLAGPVLRWTAAALSRLARVLRRDGRTDAALDPESAAARHPALDALLEGKGSR